MKIAIDGAQSTGKTTVWKDIKNALGDDDFRFIPEMNSIVANEMGIHKHSDWPALLSDAARYGIFVNSLTEAQIAQELGRSFISDSSLYRISAYAIVNGHQISSLFLEKVRYDLILYCPITLQFQDDAFRTDHFRIEVDEALRSIYAEYHNGRLVVLDGSPGDRLNQAIKEITMPISS